LNPLHQTRLKAEILENQIIKNNTGGASIQEDNKTQSSSMSERGELQL
jgi:hypothetical protein